MIAKFGFKKTEISLYPMM